MIGNITSGWLRGVDLNHRPLGYEPNELPDCSTPRLHHNNLVVERSIRVGWGDVKPLTRENSVLNHGGASLLTPKIYVLLKLPVAMNWHFAVGEILGVRRFRRYGDRLQPSRSVSATLDGFHHG